MQLTLNIGYDQILQLVQQLPSEERKRLSQELERPERNRTEQKRKMTKEEYYEFLMKGPVLNEEEIQRILDAKKMVDQCRATSF